MDITTGNTTQATEPPVKQQELRHIPPRLMTPLVEGAIMFVLALIAFFPRLLLAMKLDIVTDEVIYILGGKIYLPLLIHLRIGTSQWSFNYEHPPFVKLLIGLSLALNQALGHPLPELLTARLPSILAGTLLIVALYWLARIPFGRVVALAAALCLAVSPWLAYFSALAYLDMTMTALVTVAYLLTWHAIRRPWLYLVIALLIALGADSKYTAALAVPGIVIFLVYYFFVIRLYIPVEQRPHIPWLWWLAAIVLAPTAFFAADPAIWPHPISLLIHSFNFEINHSYNGHLTFLAGQYSVHVPQWAILYIVIHKMSAFVTIPAAFFVVFAFVQLVRFHLRKISTTEATPIAFLFIWLVSILGMFSLLNIVVGTHYHLPIAPPIALAGACGLAAILRYRRGMLSTPAVAEQKLADQQVMQPNTQLIRLRPYTVFAAVVLIICLVGPHLVGLTTVYAAEGYTSEFFPGENTTLQVAYPGYREAVQWIAAHTQGTKQVGIAAVLGTLEGSSQGEAILQTVSNSSDNNVSWYSYNSDLPSRLKLSEVHTWNLTHYNYDYLVWPMDLVQRGFPLPVLWRDHIIHTVSGGNTIYCYILARPM